MEDMPWGAEETVLHTETERGPVAVRTVKIERDEMTAYHRHRDRDEIMLVQDGIIEIRLEDDYAELGPGDAYFLEAGTLHQLQNIDDEVASVTEIAIGFDPGDVEMIEDPYAEQR